MGDDSVTLGWPAAAGGLAAIVTTLGALGVFLGWAYRQLRRWVQRTAAAAEQTAHQVQTSNGVTLAGYVEGTATRVERLEQIADANRTRIDAIDARLDRHMVTGHRVE